MNKNEIIGYVLVFICLFLVWLIGKKIILYKPKKQ